MGGTDGRARAADVIVPAPGETLLAPGARLEPGGKGANQAVAAARDGAQVLFAGAVGNDGLAQMALAGMLAAGVDMTRVARVAAPTGCAAITVDRSGRNHIVVASGANLEATAGQVESDLLKRGTMLVCQHETPPRETAGLILRARQTGARCLLNLAPAGEMPKPALEALNILVVNESEAAVLGQSLGCASTASALAETLGVNVVRSLGGEGLEADGPWGACRMAAHPVRVVDTSAAGDCLIGVLASALDRGQSWPDALARANHAAALCCTKFGTQSALPTKADVDSAQL
jgi:ribokinase